MSLSKNTNPSLVLVQLRKTHPFITERLLMGRKERIKLNKQPKQQNIEQLQNPLMGVTINNESTTTAPQS